jgi:Kef-type K+ transport system membrane component KefB/mannitol/fructose-specific phosphotransferase system IIA component (Ntr-type)
LTLPVTDPVLIVAIAMAIFLLAPLLMQRVRVPGMIGIIVAGAIVGPHGLNVLTRSSTIILLGTVGLLYLMFVAGLEIDLHGFRRYRKRSIVFGGISFSLPLLGAALLMPWLGFGVAATLLIGAIVGSHTLLAYPLVSRMGLVKNAAVTTAVGGTLVTDALSLGILAVVAGSMDGGLSAPFLLRLTAFLGLYVAVVMLGIPRLGRWFFRTASERASVEFIFLMVVLFASAFFATLAGAQPIIGAFLAGLALNRLIPNEGPLMNRIRFVGDAVFIPFFLISVGMLVDGRVLIGSLDVWIVAAALIIAVVAGKYVAAMATRRLFGYTPAEGILIFGLSVPQAAATLAVTFVGLEIGLFDETVVNAVIVMILVTVLLGPSLVERRGREVALLEEQKPFEPSEVPQRILVPMANPATAEDLMDLALLVRDEDSDQPLYPITVFPADEERSGEFVTMAEKMLSHAVAYAAGADVPVVPLTRMDHNFANGIARGIAETRTTTVIIGWDGRRTSRRWIFGGVLDQLLEQSRQQIVVAKLGHPLNTTQRIVLVVPQGSDLAPGYTQSVRMVKLMANRLGATIRAYTVGGSPRVYQEQFDGLQPEAPTRFHFVNGWPEVLAELELELKPDDLVIVLGARRGSVAWSETLERLPARLARLVPESFLMVYPSEIVVSPSSFATDALLPRALAPARVLLGVPRRPYPEVIRTLLETEFAADPPRLRRITEALATSAEAFAGELRPGVVVPHARIRDLARPMIFLGVSPEGVDFPHATEPAHLIFVLLTPEDQPDAHFVHLAEIAGLASDPSRLAVLREARTLDDLVEAAPTE